MLNKSRCRVRQQERPSQSGHPASTQKSSSQDRDSVIGFGVGVCNDTSTPSQNAREVLVFFIPDWKILFRANSFNAVADSVVPPLVAPRHRQRPAGANGIERRMPLACAARVLVIVMMVVVVLAAGRSRSRR